MPRGVVQMTDGRLVLAWRIVEKADKVALEDFADDCGIAVRTVQQWATKCRANRELLNYAQSEYQVKPLDNNLVKRPRPEDRAKKAAKTRKAKGVKPGPKPKKTNGAKPRAQHKYPVKVIAGLEDELAFMKWWNQAERNGYIDRLLKTLGE